MVIYTCVVKRHVRRLFNRSNCFPFPGLFELQSYGKSLVRLKNIKSGTFIAINSKGKVFSTVSYGICR